MSLEEWSECMSLHFVSFIEDVFSLKSISWSQFFRTKSFSKGFCSIRLTLFAIIFS
jgi:hypothetical protein